MEGDLTVGGHFPVGETGWRAWVPGPSFYARNITVANPDWTKQRHFATLDEIDFQVKLLQESGAVHYDLYAHAVRHADLDPGHAPLLTLETAAALVGAAQMDTIELHTWNALTTSIEKPDRRWTAIHGGSKTARCNGSVRRCGGESAPFE
jgi:hypothetical protein